MTILNPRLTYILFIALLFSGCTLPPNEVERPFNSQENFYLKTGNIDVEFVHDSVEYVKYFGNFNGDPVNYLSVTSSNNAYAFYNTPSLTINAMLIQNEIELDKIEVHYINLRRISNVYPPPTSSPGVILHYNLYSRETIIGDTVDINLVDRHDSVLDVNANVLNMNGYVIYQTKIRGNADNLVADFPIVPTSTPIFLNLGELVTDSAFVTFLNLNTQYPPWPNYVRADFHANSFLEIGIQNLIGTPAECPSCSVEIYYKGYPTILNHDSLDNRLVIIDNN